MAPLKQHIGFLGGGQMASALMTGFVKAEAVGGVSQISVSEPFEPMRTAHAKTGFRATASNLEVARRSDVIFLAVKPDVIATVLKEISPAVQSQLIISIAAGIPLKTMQQHLPAGARVVRVMPNLPCVVGQMAAGFAGGAAVTPDDMKLVGRLLDCVGRSEQVPEKLLDAVTGLSGSGPAYGFLMIEALADGGVRAGLPRPVALALAAQTLKGAAAMVLETGKHPGLLKDLVCSPGGTTIAGVEALERRGFRSAAMGAVTAATDRAVQLSKL